MKTISCWDHLRPYGINPLTGEACALAYRILCDITEEGKRVIEKCLSCELKPPENWNAGAIGAVMLVPEMLVPIAVFALLDAGCRECWVIGREVVGVESSDDDRTVQRLVQANLENHPRRFAYHQGSDRNRHQMSGRLI